jgi:hypothetical protein
VIGGWLPNDFFIGQPGPVEARPRRPLGQGDVFEAVPVAVRTGVRNGQAGASATLETVMVVSSSCGMRKDAGQLNDLVHVAPVKRLDSLAPGWREPWSGHLAILPLPGMTIGDAVQPAAANLARIGLCTTSNLALEMRLASVSLAGMQALKCRISMYFTRAPIASGLFAVGAHEEWHELDLWERWTARFGHEDGFQEWLDQANPDFPTRTRRATIYDDLAGITRQLEEIAGAG